ncbi:hypothetical protein VTO42DRAFT_157 [Malbranchea cinnamomea]
MILHLLFSVHSDSIYIYFFSQFVLLTVARVWSLEYPLEDHPCWHGTLGTSPFRPASCGSSLFVAGDNHVPSFDTLISTRVQSELSSGLVRLMNTGICCENSYSTGGRVRFKLDRLTHYYSTSGLAKDMTGVRANLTRNAYIRLSYHSVTKSQMSKDVILSSAQACYPEELQHEIGRMINYRFTRRCTLTMLMVWQLDLIRAAARGT